MVAQSWDLARDTKIMDSQEAEDKLASSFAARTTIKDESDEEEDGEEEDGEDGEEEDDEVRENHQVKNVPFKSTNNLKSS